MTADKSVLQPDPPAHFFFGQITGRFDRHLGCLIAISFTSIKLHALIYKGNNFNIFGLALNLIWGH